MNNLHEALFKDLVESTSFSTSKTSLKIRSVRNPLNIIAMLENLDCLPKNIQEYVDKLKLKQSQFNENSSRKTSGVICKILTEESLFLKRFDFLVHKIENLNLYALAIVDLKSVNVLQHSINCGLEVNAQLNDTYLLKHAIENKNTTIANYLYGLPNIDKYKVDSKGNNLAHFLAINKNYKLISILSKQSPELFYVNNKENKTAIDIIFNYKQYVTLPTNNRMQLKESILMFLNLHNTGTKLLSEDTVKIIENTTVLTDIFTEANYMKLSNKLVYKEKSLMKTKVIKI